MRLMVDGLRLAFAFLTAFPVPPQNSHRPDALASAAIWFPLVGCMVGLAAAASKYALELLFPVPLASALVLLVWVAATGALHLDGLADCCDGLLAAVEPQRRLEIMRDPRLGTFGGAGLLLYLLVKYAAVGSAMPLAALFIFPLAASTARWLVLLVALQPNARSGGLGAGLAHGLSLRKILAALPLPLVFAALCAVNLSVWHTLAALALAALLCLGIITLARRRLGGVTGDVMGLSIEVVETTVLVVFAAL